MARKAAQLEDPAVMTGSRSPGADGFIELERAPAIPGLRFRAYRDERDVAPVVEVYNAANLANGLTEVCTVAAMRNELGHLSHIDPREDFLLAFVGDRLTAVSRIGWADTTDGVRYYHSDGHVHPEWRRRGIGSAMLARNEARITEIAAGHDLREQPRLISWVEDGDPGALALFSGNGYARARVFHHMVRPDLDDIWLPPVPHGLEVRAVEPAQLERLWAALTEAFRDHHGGHDASAEAMRRWSGDPNFDLGLVVVAFEREEIAAGVHGRIDALENEAQGYRRGWADPIFTRRPWRRRGLASALLGLALVRLRERGMTSAQLDVDAQNPNAASSLYRRHGFEVDRSSSEWHKPFSV